MTPRLSSLFFCSIILASLLMAGFSMPLNVLLNQPLTRPGLLPAISV